MSVTSGVRFGRYRFDATQGLTRGRHEVHVTPKSLAVLGVLLDRAGEVVTKDELFLRVWPGTTVSDAALTTCVQELRRVLADNARRPRFIETVPRRGFRFVARSSTPAMAAPSTVVSSPSSPFVGRDAALEQLADAWARARAGQRQLVFVRGEPGIGKTALVNLFLESLSSQRGHQVARADCVEHHGAGEAYQPLLEALTRRCAHGDREPWLATLRRCAPTWLAQLPAVQTPQEHEALQRRTAGATCERMLRELTDALEAVARRSTLVLCLEDLHWSDVSTLDWLASFARRPDPAAVLVIGTYRTGEMARRSCSPEALTDDLGVKGHCVQIDLGRLDAEQVRAYVTARLPAADGAADSLHAVAVLLHQRTDGNPLFVSAAVTDLIARGVVVKSQGRWRAREDVQTAALTLPVDVRRVRERQVDRLTNETREWLEVGSVAGGTFAAAAVAAAVNVSVGRIEATLGALARQEVLVRDVAPAEWPDGTLSATFEFAHSLYREVLSSRIAPTRGVELHRAIGRRLEAAYGERAADIASELARHFEQARDVRSAVDYLQRAAETASSRSAHRVAQDHYRRALDLLQTWPADDDRDEREVALRIGLGNVLMQTSGWGAADVQATYVRVRHLSERADRGASLFPALWNLWIFYATRGELDEAWAFADRLLALATQTGDPGSLLQAHHARWSTLFMLGDLQGAEAHAREGMRLADAGRQATIAYGGHDAGICARLFCAQVLALRAYTDRAVVLSDEGVALARAFDHPFTLAFALMHAAAVRQIRCDVGAAHEYAAEATRVACDHSFDLMRAWAKSLLGWSMVELGDARGGLAAAGEGVASARATGSSVFQPHMLGLLATAQIANGLVTDAQRTLDEALELSDRTGERFYDAELYRLRGEVRLVSSDRPDGRRMAEADFHTSIRLAERQGALLLAQRSSASLESLRN